MSSVGTHLEIPISCLVSFHQLKLTVYLLSMYASHLQFFYTSDRAVIQAYVSQ
jgi:hypothetical protein